MSRIYSNDPLTSLPVKNIFLDGAWNPSAYQRGEGVLLEGAVTGLSRFAVNDSTKNKCRYFLIVVRIARGYKRIFDDSNVEIEADLTKCEKVRTGHLQSSYKLVQKDTLRVPELIALTQPNDVMQKFSVEKPNEDCLALLLDENILDNRSISVDDGVRLKTKGFGPFIETISRMNEATATKSHYAGDEDIGDNWTSRIMSAKERQEDRLRSEREESDDCVADAEWDD